jgi:hypothetical protein
MKMEYPKFLYHATEVARVVNSIQEHELLGAGWHESPLPSAADLDAVEAETSTPGHLEMQPRVENFKKRRK